MVWEWLPEYAPRFIEGIWVTLQLLGLSIFFGMLLAIPIGLVRVRHTTPYPVVVDLLRPWFIVSVRTGATRELSLAHPARSISLCRFCFHVERCRAIGMSRFQVLRRIWLPRALQNVFPTLAGEFILTLKATPLAATITVFEVYGVSTIVRQETYRIYEPLLFVAGIYIFLTICLVILFRFLETMRKVPVN